MTVADAWRRSKRRHAWLVALGTLALTAVVFWFFTLPSWWKIASRNWPSTLARIDGTSSASSSANDAIIAGRRVKVRFSYATPDGTRREAKQEVSVGWAREHAIGEYGYLIPADIMRRGRAPDRIPCYYDPADPGHALLERSLGHADVPALFPLLVLLFGGIMFVAERRSAARADDLGTRTASRNGDRWSTNGFDGSLTASSSEGVSVDLGMLVVAAINWPAVSVHVAPHPARLGSPLAVTLSFTSRRRWRRRLRVRLMLGPFNTSGRARHARWSADVFDGQLDPNVTIRETFALPRPGDLPPGVDDCWIRVTARTTLGLPWSRTLWIALDDRNDR